MESYSVFTDESHVTAARYRSVAAVSMPTVRVPSLRSALSAALVSSNVREFKWKKLQSAKYRFAAQKLATQAFEALDPPGLRLDVLVWDTQDERHSVRHRNDRANYERMFFHLLRWLMQRRGQGTTWEVFPDERTGGGLGDCARLPR